MKVYSLQIDKFTYPAMSINSVRMLHHAARGHAFSAKYDAAVQNSIIAASMRTDLVDFLTPQDETGGG
jgi:hypothetical protein